MSHAAYLLLDIYSFSFVLYMSANSTQRLQTVRHILTDQTLQLQNGIAHIYSFLSLGGPLISIVDCTLEMLWQTAIAQGQSAPCSCFIRSACSSVSFLAYMQQYSHQSLLFLLRKKWKLTANRARFPHAQHTMCVDAAGLPLDPSPTRTHILPELCTCVKQLGGTRTAS